MRPEQARAALEAQKLADADERRSRRIRALHGEAAKAARQLNEEHWFFSGQDPNRTSAARLDALSTEERTAVFTALQPQLGHHLERMWQSGVGRPYQFGVARRAFRAPRHPVVSLPTRHMVLTHVLDVLRPYEPDAIWVARWSAHLSAEYLADALGTFSAAVIDGGDAEGEAAFDILVASAQGEDEVGSMGRHVPRALLSASREAGWAFIERMLLAAQRAEGVRQAILESVDEAHPIAYRRMLRTIVERDLLRFPATVRAINVWFDVGWSAASGRGLSRLLERVVRLLEEDDERERALRHGSGEEAYFALWSVAYADALAAVPLASSCLSDEDPERRFAAVHLLALLGVSDAVGAVAPALDDPDLRVATRALDAVLAAGTRRVDGAPPETFERLERLLARLPEKSVSLDPVIWPWTGRSIQRETVAGGLVTYLAQRTPESLIAHLSTMDAGSRAAVALKLAMDRRPSAETRRALVSLAGDPSAQVRGLALEAVKRMAPGEDETIELEKLLTRKAGDLRRSVVTMLLARGSRRALESADRLLATTSPMQRLAGLEVLRRLAESGKDVRGARDRARRYRDEAAELGEMERSQLDAILGTTATASAEQAAGARQPTEDQSGPPKVPTIHDGFGLLDHARRTVPQAPSRREVTFVSDAAAALLVDLDRLVHEHRNERIRITTWSGDEEQLLGEVARGFPAPPGGGPTRMAQVAAMPGPADVAGALERGRAGLPLPELWEGWWANRGAALREPDGLELIRAHLTPVTDPPGLPQPTDPSFRAVDDLLGAGRPPVEIRYHHVTSSIVTWLAIIHPAPGTPRFLLDAAEQTLVSIPPGTPLDGDHHNWRNPTVGWRDDGSPWLVVLRLARSMRRMRPDLWTADDHARLWRIERWIDEGGRSDLGPAELHAAAWASPPSTTGALVRDAVGNVVSKLRKGRSVAAMLTRPPRSAPPIEEVVAAFRFGAASEDDVIDRLVGPGAHGEWFRTLGAVSGRRVAAEDPSLGAIVERIRRRLVEIELRRGEAPTEASRAALVLQYSGGLDMLVRLLRALGTEPFVRGWSYDGESRHVVFSRLIRAAMPGPLETPAAFADAVRAADIGERRLVELGCFAPQWADHVETAVGWPGLASAIWWMHAHTKDPSWIVGSEVREAWAAAVSERSPLEPNDLVDGAVDVDWFTRVHSELGDARWKVLDAAAKYCSTGGGHKRAQLFADAMRGAATDADLRTRVDERRHQDAVRALGLVPLPATDATERDGRVLERYGAFQEFIRTSRQFGSSRQASEKRAAEIGLANLARTAGYADPIRLSWAMEARGVADLADGPLSATADGVTVSLTIDAAGEPSLSVSRDGVALKAVPATARKNRDISALRARATELRRQARRIRRSLELSMIRGDMFTAAELADLLEHPLIAPVIRRLVFIGHGACGYPADSGRGLVDTTGRAVPIASSSSVRLAHPLDLLATADWSAWQADVFRRELVQPFKQVFREVYVATETERDDKQGSSRYAGHQVNPRQALALLTGRGWVTAPERGVSKSFHDVRVSAFLTFLEPFFSPAEVDGLTIEKVLFARSGEDHPIPPGEVPPRVFSEIMRDLDLVVSVAHAGGVDPEVSASTVEFRTALVSETVRILGLDNVTLDAPRAIIAGRLGEYSVHLGSAVVHRRPGGALFIVPIHAQYRGRLFLPFADDDPRTAEVLAKVLLLSRDDEIRDPAILDQIRSGGS